MKDKSLTTVIRNLSNNTRNALVKGALVAIITAIIYLTVVVVTTPNLPAYAAINAALKVNGIIIIGLGIGVGIQIFTSTYSKGLGCRLDDKRKDDKEQQYHKGIRRIFSIGGRTGSSGGSTAISSFLSFFSLVPLGCCGSWLFVLSMLPSIFGGTLSVMLIEYSIVLSYVSLGVVIGFAALSVLRLRKELCERQLLEARNPNSSDDRTSKTLESEPGGARARGLD
jgi:hypothetical protein